MSSMKGTISTARMRTIEPPVDATGQEAGPRTTSLSAAWITRAL